MLVERLEVDIFFPARVPVWTNRVQDSDWEVGKGGLNADSPVGGWREVDCAGEEDGGFVFGVGVRGKDDFAF